MISHGAHFFRLNSMRLNAISVSSITELWVQPLSIAANIFVKDPTEAAFDAL